MKRRTLTIWGCSAHADLSVYTCDEHSRESTARWAFERPDTGLVFQRGDLVNTNAPCSVHGCTA
jgi:hypothetical protein